MEILDAQVHCWLTDHPSRPWVARYRPDHLHRLPMLIHAGQSASPETVLIAMAEAGVDGGLLTPVGVYGEDNDFELTTAERFPRRFGVLGYVDHLAADLADALRRDAARGLLGVRILGLREPERHERGEFDAVLGLCQELGLAVALSLVHPLDPQLIGTLARYEGIAFLIDHLGVGLAPPLLGPAPADPFANLPAVLDLARLPNVAFKLTGAPSLSHEIFPFPDLFDPVLRVLDAFGPERVMWGSDFTRTNGLHSYWSATQWLAHVPHLDDKTLAQLYGGTLRAVLRWAPTDPTTLRTT